MKRLAILLACLLSVTCFFNCSNLFDRNPENVVKTNCWKLTDTEIWWVAPTDNDHPYLKIDAIPFEQAFNCNYGNVVYSGVEGSIILTEETRGSINYTWTVLPDYIYPSQEFVCEYESKGTIGKGIGISHPTPVSNNVPKWFSFSSRDGMKSAKLSIPIPEVATETSEQYYEVELSSDGFYYIRYKYIYEWMPK